MSENEVNLTNDINLEKTEEETNRKCPNCAATVVYDPATRGMLCEFCGYKKQLPTPEGDASVSELDFESAETRESFNWGAEKKTVLCSNCSGESIYDALETAAVCPFCGSTSVMPSASEKSMAPGGVCPFEIPVNKAGGLFSGWLSKKIFTPSKAKREAKPDAFAGIYLPYWTFDTMTSSSFTGRAGYDTTVMINNKPTMQTDWKHVSGMYQEFIDDFTVVASSRNADSGVRRAEPFDFSKLVPYRPELVAGFIAERYSIGLKDAWNTAQEGIRKRLNTSIDKHIRTTWHASRADSIHFSTLFQNLKYKYILIPVWISSFKYKGKLFQFVVNGQTGKVGGKAPVSPLRVAIAILIGLGLIGLAIYLTSL